MPQTGRKISLFEIASTFALVGMISFGGNLVGYIQQIIVRKKEWLSEDEFLEGVELCQILPGPNAIKLAVYLGRHFRGKMGASVAFFSMVLPPAALILLIGAFYFQYSSLPFVSAIFIGIGGAVVGLTLASTIQLGYKHFSNLIDLAVILIVFLASSFQVPLLMIFALVGPISIGLHLLKSKTPKKG